jgi:hypothetical protein
MMAGEGERADDDDENEDEEAEEERQQAMARKMSQLTTASRLQEQFRVRHSPEHLSRTHTRHPHPWPVVGATVGEAAEEHHASGLSHTTLSLWWDVLPHHQGTTQLIAHACSHELTDLLVSLYVLRTDGNACLTSQFTRSPTRCWGASSRRRSEASLARMASR